MIEPVLIKDIDVVCDSCDSVFTLSYQADMTTDQPAFCPFCGEICDSYIPSDACNEAEEGDNSSWIEIEN